MTTTATNLSTRRHRVAATDGRLALSAPPSVVCPEGANQAGRALVHRMRFVIVVSRFNPAITRALLRGAVEVLRRSGVIPQHIRTVWVPGAFELPAAAARLAKTRPRPDAIIALGAVIRGQTPQYGALAHAVTEGLSSVSVRAVIPVTLGVIVADSVAQAKARAGLPAPRAAYRGKAQQAGGRMGNRGAEAALAALEMVHLFKKLGSTTLGSDPRLRIDRARTGPRLRID